MHWQKHFSVIEDCGEIEQSKSRARELFIKEISNSYGSSLDQFLISSLGQIIVNTQSKLVI